MKWIFFLFCILLLITNSNFLGANPLETEQSQGNSFIEVGQKYEFNVRHKMLIWIPCGKVTTEVLEKTEIMGHQCFHLRMIMKLGGVAGFFKRDFYFQIDSWVTVDDLVTLKWRQYEKEGDWEKTIDIEVFSATQKAFFETETINPDTTFYTIKDILPEAHDFLSLLFLTTTLEKADLKPGQNFYINALAENRHDSYKLEIKILDRKILEIDGQKINCFRIEPLYQKSGIFDDDSPERTIIWFDYEKKVIVRIDRGADKLTLKIGK